MIVFLLAGVWLAANCGAQTNVRSSSSSKTQMVAGKEAGFAINLRDPFSPVGYRAPMSDWQAPTDPGAVAPGILPPSVDLKAKAKSLLHIRGIVKRGNTYVANVNGSIVQAGDEVSVMADGQEVVFIIRSISLTRVEVEPK